MKCRTDGVYPIAERNHSESISNVAGRIHKQTHTELCEFCHKKGMALLTMKSLPKEEMNAKLSLH